MIDDGLDPDLRTFRDRVLADYARLGGVYRDVAHRRAVAELVRSPWATGGPIMASTIELPIAGVRCRLHRPVDMTGLPVLVYLHGGGFVLGGLESHDDVCAEMAAKTGIDIYLGSGGAPEGVLAAAALRCIGGQIQGRLMPSNDEEIARAKKMGIARVGLATQ